MAYVGPGIEIWRTQGAPKRRRERWWSLSGKDGSLTAVAIRISIILAYYGRPDGSHIWVSQARIAKDTGLSVGTVSRAITELEDAGWLIVRRHRWRRSPEGELAREVNHYTLAVPPSDAADRGIKGTHKRRASSPCPAEVHRAYRERAMAERRAKIEEALAAVNGASEAGRICELPSLGTCQAALEADLRPAEAATAAEGTEEPVAPPRALLAEIRAKLGPYHRRRPPPGPAPP